MNEAMQQSQQPEPIGTAGLAGAALNRPMREKYWEECDAEQKLERLRDAVARVCRETTMIAAAIQRLAAHSHGDRGELLVPIHHADPTANYAQGALAGGGNLYAHDHGIPYDLRTKHERR